MNGGGDVPRGQIDEVVLLERGGRLNDAACDVPRMTHAKMAFEGVEPFPLEIVIVALGRFRRRTRSSSSAPGFRISNKVKHLDVVFVSLVRRFVSEQNGESKSARKF